MRYSVAVVNQSESVSKSVTAGALAALVSTLQTQVSRDFAPAWGVDADVRLVSDNAAPPGWWQLVLLDDSDSAGALGYHDMTAEGLPLGKVFVRTDLMYGDKLSVTASHELLEMLADPYVSTTAQAADGYHYAVEVCDPCEMDSQGYDIDGVTVSNFVLPAYWRPAGVPGEATDHLNALGGARCPTLLPGGYVSRLDPSTGQWTQVVPPDSTTQQRVRARGPVGSRRWRRTLRRDHWIASEL